MLGGEQFKLSCAVRQNPEEFLEQRAGPRQREQPWPERRLSLERCCQESCTGSLRRGSCASSTPISGENCDKRGVPLWKHILEREKKLEEKRCEREERKIWQREHQGESRMKGKKCSRCWNRRCLAAHRGAMVKQKFMLQPLLRTYAGAAPGGPQEGPAESQLLSVYNSHFSPPYTMWSWEC